MADASSPTAPDAKSPAPTSGSSSARRRGATQKGSSFRTGKVGVSKAIKARSARANPIAKGKKASKKTEEDEQASLSPWVLGLLVFVVIGSAIVGIFATALNGR